MNKIPVPWPVPVKPEINIFDHVLKVVMETRMPKAILFQNFLTDEECDCLVLEAEPSFSRSTAIDTETGKSEIFHSRTSEGTFFKKAENDLVKKIEERICKLFHWNDEQVEPLQMLKYNKGEEYLPHFDYFDPLLAGSKIHIEQGGQRVATLLMYLSTPEEGGYTYFPAVDMKIHCVKGNALLFVYPVPIPESLTSHAGTPVITGTKHVATAWFRSKKS